MVARGFNPFPAVFDHATGGDKPRPYQVPQRIDIETTSAIA
jgi:hypothetical protein